MTEAIDSITDKVLIVRAILASYPPGADQAAEDLVTLGVDPLVVAQAMGEHKVYTMRLLRRTVAKLDGAPWAIGDPDPTPNHPGPGAEFCSITNPARPPGTGDGCTWRRGHAEAGEWHVAGDGAKVLDVWSVQQT